MNVNDVVKESKIYRIEKEGNILEKLVSILLDNNFTSLIDNIVSPYKEGSIVLDKIFIYFDQRHITGTDIKHYSSAKALVSCFPYSKYRDIARGIYRMRNRGIYRIWIIYMIIHLKLTKKICYLLSQQIMIIRFLQIL